jgi:hypothetical protein
MSTKQAECHHHFVVGGTCNKCGLKRQDHEAMLAKIREHFANQIEHEAEQLDAFEMLPLAQLTRDGKRLKTSADLASTLEECVERVTGDVHRMSEFVPDILYIFEGDPRNDQAVKAFIVECLKFSLIYSGSNLLASDGDKLQAGQKIAPSVVAEDVLRHELRKIDERVHLDRFQRLATQIFDYSKDGH